MDTTTADLREKSVRSQTRLVELKLIHSRLKVEFRSSNVTSISRLSGMNLRQGAQLMMPQVKQIPTRSSSWSECCTVRDCGASGMDLKSNLLRIPELQELEMCSRSRITIRNPLLLGYTHKRFPGSDPVS